ncbi:hypothetical protein C2845_PM13G03690 [Panicum miliaceum]|uniref:FAD-binding PCMH-type domain-containing protein n=1 Tax=Panicum miliaceum TaxID=4540 RepID=A0A3L6RGP9_PANMI|nr:hypothetical protein C2845_PM13G03690 [Panicum miliaceum]
MVYKIQSYAALLNSSISNLRFTLPGVGRPVAVVFPGSWDGLRAAVLCARGAWLAVRVRSGGRSYEGLSYTTENHGPFAVIDLASLNRVRVDRGSATAWAEADATLGELYNAAGRSSRSLAFPGGTLLDRRAGRHHLRRRVRALGAEARARR